MSVTPAELHLWRTSRGLTLDQLAALLSVDRTAIYRWERESGPYKRKIPPFLERALRDVERELAARLTPAPSPEEQP